MKKAHLRRRLSSEGASTAPFRTSPQDCAGEAGARLAALHLDLFDQPALGAVFQPPGRLLVRPTSARRTGAALRSEQIEARGRRAPEVYDQARLRRDSVPADVRPTTERVTNGRRPFHYGHPPKVGRATLIGAALKRRMASATRTAWRVSATSWVRIRWAP